MLSSLSSIRHALTGGLGAIGSNLSKNIKTPKFWAYASARFLLGALVNGMVRLAEYKATEKKRPDDFEEKLGWESIRTGLLLAFLPATLAPHRVLNFWAPEINFFLASHALAPLLKGGLKEIRPRMREQFGDSLGETLAWSTVLGVDSLTFLIMRKFPTGIAGKTMGTMASLFVIGMTHLLDMGMQFNQGKKEYDPGRSAGEVLLDGLMYGVYGKILEVPLGLTQGAKAVYFTVNSMILPTTTAVNYTAYVVDGNLKNMLGASVPWLLGFSWVPRSLQSKYGTGSLLGMLGDYAFSPAVRYKINEYLPRYEEKPETGFFAQL